MPRWTEENLEGGTMRQKYEGVRAIATRIAGSQNPFSGSDTSKIRSNIKTFQTNYNAWKELEDGSA